MNDCVSPALEQLFVGLAAVSMFILGIVFMASAQYAWTRKRKRYLWVTIIPRDDRLYPSDVEPSHDRVMAVKCRGGRIDRIEFDVPDLADLQLDAKVSER